MDRRETYIGDRKRKALVVDDESVNRQLLGFIVNREYDVISAENGKEALEKIKENRGTLSIILLDLMMPEMDGFELMTILKDEDILKEIPVIVLTSEESAEVKSLEYGAVDFIKKPYDAPEIILARIKRTIELFEDRNILNATERDELTNLYNKDFFFEYARQFDKYHVGEQMDAVTIDVENFHLVNEINGRGFGDKVLKQIAESIMAIYGSGVNGYACRYDADRFYMYCTHIDDFDDMIRERIVSDLNKLSANRRIRVRFGIYPNVDHKLEMEQRFDRARTACNLTRGNLAQYVGVYDEKIYEDTVFKERLVSDIHEAVANHDLVVYYQPKYGIDGDEPELRSAEALIRWIHPELGFINPGSFIPLFEENGLIQELDHFVWEEAAKQVREWKDKYDVSLPVSVNVSRIDIYDPNLENDLLDILKKNDLTTDDIYLEITESAYANDMNNLIGVVESLRNKGFRIEMDDFGSGYSSLNMLATLPFDVMKLDMKFVQNVHRDKKSFRLIELIMEIADYLGVPVVAEGVEEEEQYMLLKLAGCAVIQGFYFSKPVNAEEFSKFIEEGLAATNRASSLTESGPMDIIRL